MSEYSKIVHRVVYKDAPRLSEEEFALREAQNSFFDARQIENARAISQVLLLDAFDESAINYSENEDERLTLVHEAKVRMNNGAFIASRIEKYALEEDMNYDHIPTIQMVIDSASVGFQNVVSALFETKNSYRDTDLKLREYEASTGYVKYIPASSNRKRTIETETETETETEDEEFNLDDLEQYLQKQARKGKNRKK